MDSGASWSLSDIPWDRFDPTRADPDIVKIVKAASLVEANGRDYATYLCNVFAGDPDFQAMARAWSHEEEQHGAALGHWAELADSGFDFESCLARFRAGYRLPLDTERSVRGSRVGELVARCVVEVGTSSYYAALGEATREPALKAICRRIEVDELRHYKRFYLSLKRYLERERVSRPRRLAIALSRIGEAEDDELAFAYHAANGNGEAYDRKRSARAYLARAHGVYRQRHFDRATALILKAAGLSPRGRLSRMLAWAGYRIALYKGARAAAAEARTA